MCLCVHTGNEGRSPRDAKGNWPKFQDCRWEDDEVITT